VPAPLNVGNIGQSKEGGLILGTNCIEDCTNGLIIDKGKVGIGTTNPGEKLEVQVNIKISGTDKGIIFPDGSVLKTASAGMLPSGVIVMWSGTLASIPSGWALADGTNGTPDLRDKFIYGVSASENPGATGGATSHSHTYSTVPLHNHSASVSTDGSHSHGNGIIGTSSFGNFVGAGNSYLSSANTTAGGSHTHTVTIGSTGSTNPTTATTSSLPPYYKLAFIMKI